MVTIPAAPVKILLLGPAVVVRDGREIRLGDRQRAVLTALAANPGDVITTERLIDRVWAGDPPASAASAVRVHLSKIRRVLSRGGNNAVPRLPTGYRLEPDGIATDLAELKALTSRIDLSDPTTAEPLLSRALDLFRGEPLADLHDDESRAMARGLLEIRERLAEDRLDVLLAMGEESSAIELAAELVRADPLRERRTRQLMLGLYRAGRQADALAAGGRLRELLREELGVGPAPDTAELEVLILRQDQSLLRPRQDTPLPDRHRTPHRPRTPRQLMNAPIRDLITARLADAPEASRTVAMLITLLDDLPQPRLIAAATGLTSDEVLAAGHDLARRGIITAPVPGAPFTLTRTEFATALAEMLSDDERALLHERAADGVERALSPDAYALTAVAWHRLAGPDPRGERTLGAVAQAAASCVVNGFPESAQALCEAAMDQQIPDPARLDITRLLIEALFAQGGTERAELEWAKGLELARAIDDPERFALTALTRTWIARSVMLQSNFVDVLEEALERLGPGPTALRVRVQAAVLLEASVPGARRVTAREDIRALRLAADRVGDPESLRFALLTEHALLRSSPDLTARTAIADELLGMSQGLPTWECHGLTESLNDTFTLGRFEAVPDLIHRLEVAAKAANVERPRWMAHLAKATLHRDMGRFPEADRLAEAGLLIGATGGLPDAMAAHASHQLVSLLLRDSLTPLLPALERFWAAAPDNASTAAAIALALAHSGRGAEGKQWLERSVTTMLNTPPNEFTVFAVAVAAEALWAGAEGSADLPPTLAECMEPYAGQFVTLGLVSSSLGPVDRILGLLAAVAGDWERARAKLTSAQHGSAEAGTPVWEIRSAADRVRVSPRSTGRELAARYLRRARELGLGPSVRIFEAVQ